MKRIKTNRWQRQRQWHMTSAGLRAGLGLAGGHLRTLGLSGDALQEARDQLMFEQASAWVAELGELKDTVVKMGQILATYADYCLPQPIAQALHQLDVEYHLKLSAPPTPLGSILDGKQHSGRSKF